MRRGGGRRGLTLAEVLVASAILIIITVGLTDLYRISFHAYSLGAVHTQLQQRARLVEERIAQELRTAVQPGTTGTAVEYPPVGTTSASYVIFNRGDGTWANGASPIPGVNFDPRNPQFRRWAVYFDPTAGTVRLPAPSRQGPATYVPVAAGSVNEQADPRRVADEPSGLSYATTAWKPLTTWAVLPANPPAVVIASLINPNNPYEDVALTALTFARYAAPSVQVSITVQGMVHSNTGRDLNETLTSVTDVPIPYYTLSH